MRSRGSLVALACVAFLLTFVAEAFADVSSWDTLSSRLKAGDKVQITLVDGGTRTGEVRAIRPDGLTIRDGEAEATLDRAVVKQIRKVGGSRHSGLAWGALVGGAAAAGISIYTFGICSNEGGSNCSSLKATGLIGPLAAGIGVGALIDAGRNKRESVVVYEQAPRVSVAPMALPHGYGVQVRMAFGRR